MKEWWTTREVADLLGITPGRVRQIVGACRDQGEPVGTKMARDWFFSAADVKTIRARNTRVGRPATHEGSPGA